MGGAVQPSIDAVNDVAHPATRNSNRFSLHDKFHLGNSKQRKTLLLWTSLIKELDDVITATAEELNAFRATTYTFSTVLAPFTICLCYGTYIPLGMRKLINV